MLPKLGCGNLSLDMVPTEADISVETAKPIFILLEKFYRRVLEVRGTVSLLGQDGERVSTAGARAGAGAATPNIGSRGVLSRTKRSCGLGVAL